MWDIKPEVCAKVFALTKLLLTPVRVLSDLTLQDLVRENEGKNSTTQEISKMKKKCIIDKKEILHIPQQRTRLDLASRK